MNTLATSNFHDRTLSTTSLSARQSTLTVASAPKAAKNRPVIRRRSKLVVHLALALALLLAQAGALFHVGTHDARGAHGGAPHVSLCGQCLSFSTVLSGAGHLGGALEVLFLAGLGLAAIAVAPLASNRTPHHFWSRGPPSAQSC